MLHDWHICKHTNWFSYMVKSPYKVHYRSNVLAHSALAIQKAILKCSSQHKCTFSYSALRMCDCVLGLPVWTLMCSFRLLLLTKDLSHMVQWKRLAASCRARCIFRLCLVAKLFPQTLHECGRTPVWFSMWMRKEYSLGSVLPQMSHTNSRLVRPLAWPSNPSETSSDAPRAKDDLWVFWCLWRAKWARRETGYWNSLLHSWNKISIH